MTWKQDRETLRNYIRENKPEGEAATALYVLVAHMHGKLHMNYCNSYDPYANGRYRTTSELPDKKYKLFRAYGIEERFYTKMVYIGSLADQEAWFSEVGRKSMKYLPPEFDSIADRVFSGYPEEKYLPELAVSV